MNRFVKGVLAAGLGWIVLLAAACATSGGDRIVVDPAGRFSFRVPRELVPRVEREGFYQYRMEAPGLDVYVVAAEAALEEKGIEEVLDRVGVERSRLVMGGSATFGDWQALRWHLGTDSSVAFAYQVRGGTIYALAVRGTQEAMPRDPPSAVMRVLGSVKFMAPAGSPTRASTREELEEEIERAAAARSGSISVAVIRNGTIVYRFAAGASGMDRTATPATAYHWGSMTKLVTATAVMELVQRGSISLDAPVERYLPEFPKLGITVRQLLGHSSGLTDPEADHLVSFAGSALPPLREVLSRYLAGGRITLFPPGSDAAYSNWNYLVLGVIVERASGIPYSEFVTRTILQPLGMSHTAFRYAELPGDNPLATPIVASAGEADLRTVLDSNRPEHDSALLIAGRSGGLTYLADFDILAPWGGLEGTPEDVARFLGMSMGRPPVGAPAILSEATLASMRRAQHSPSGRTLPWALGWMVRQEKGEEVIEQGGGGPGIDDIMRIYPGRGLGVVVMGNVQAYGASRILAAAADIFSRDSP